MDTRKIYYQVLAGTVVLLIGINRLTSANRNPLEGRRAPCQYEGEPVAVDHIDTQNCYSCICKNGFVECKNDYLCPPTDGCHMLVEKDGCCKKCKGCIYRQVHHLSHTEWTEPDDPCKVLRCEAGVVTESDVRCHTPCANALPPEPGKCCATCPECKMNGQIATDDRDVISDDPCLKCRCSGGRMICSKKACPVLQCDQKRQEYLPGECCPRCTGTRTLFSFAGTCTLQSSFFHDGQQFNIDRCTTCNCINETSVCKRAACPILDCAPDMQQSTPGSCCKKCVLPEQVKTQCSYGGKIYEDGQSWKLNACRSCKCHRGMPSCAMTRCNVTLPCPPGTRLVHVPGECCEKCVEVEGVCMIFGDPHYKTFDGKIYNFEGIGKFQLAADCTDQTFSIRVANTFTNRYQRTSTSTKRVAIRYGDTRVNLQQKTRVKLNGERIKIPHKIEGKLRIEKNQDSIEVFFQNGLKIYWTGKSFLEISVPATYKGRMCGLCGNFNDNVQDDFKTRQGRIVKDNEVLNFGASWCAGDKPTCLKHAKQTSKIIQCSAHRPEKNRCKYFNNNELFADCDSKLNYNKYYRTCKMDMCNCPNGKCYCESLLAYARECERLGVKLPNWKKFTLCDSNQIKRPKSTSKVPQLLFTKEDIARITRQRNLNRTAAADRIPILIH